MKQPRHLYFNKLREIVVNPTAKAVSLENLQTLLGLRASQSTCIEQGLKKLSKLKELELHGHLIQHEEALGQWIINSKDLQCLKMHTRRTSDITTSAIPKSITLSNHFHLYKLHLNGFKRRLFDVQDFPPNLTELCLERWSIEEGALCNHREFEIVECKRLKIAPRGLWPVTTLSNLKLGDMPYEFQMMAQDRNEENWYRLEHVLPM
ncbi:hypothetical protein QYF36_023595 [Acer negundo]|nr:hypothetical protein QYF36_023595 [Acer negundo]